MKKVLVVDDEEKIRAILRKYGEFEGYEITEAGNARLTIDTEKNRGNKNENFLEPPKERESSF